MERKLQNIIVTGGAGFIGANFIEAIFKSTFRGNVINVDSLTYASDLENLKNINLEYGGSRYFFEKKSICDNLEEIINYYNIDSIVHFAAESHVDNSISGPEVFIDTNIKGTFNLLEMVRKYNLYMHHVSTDEVFGSVEGDVLFSEKTPYNPSSPYSASKAAADHLVRSYGHTYGIDFTISNCSNNYGPFQFYEKLIPLVISRIINNKEIPVYGTGKNIRDWIYVEDHVNAIIRIMNKSPSKETYCIGGDNELENIELINIICEIMAEKLKKKESRIKSLITYVRDRPGHDARYAIDSSKIKNNLNWCNSVGFEKGIEKTIDWYLVKFKNYLRAL